MTTPLTTIADALIEFILSLLRDPAALAEFEQSPDEVLSRSGFAGVCAEDVRAVAPVIVDSPTVVPKVPSVPPQPPGPPDVVREIREITNNLTIDNRSTIVDQSVNQNIWADGDVNQIFDQEAVLATGDDSVAAGRDADIDNSTSEVTAGDVSIGNTDISTDVTDSFNDSSTNTDVDVDPSDADAPADGSDPAAQGSSAPSADASTAVDTAETPVEMPVVEIPPAPEPEPEPEPEAFEYDSASVDMTEPAPEFLDEEP